MEEESSGSAFGALPPAISAYGWIPFLIVLVFCLLFSVFYVLIHRASSPRYLGTTIITILGLFCALISSVLVPVDVFLVSYMKKADGTWMDWAQRSEDREAVKESMLYCYYTCYSVILVFCFLIFPANFFYHGVSHSPDDQEEAEASCGRKLCTSLQYTFLSLLLFGGLCVAGIFLPFNGVPPSNETDFAKFEWYIDQLESNKGEDLLIFILNTLNLVGMCLMIVYTGFGLSTFPLGTITTHRRVDNERQEVSSGITDLEQQIQEIRSRSEDGTTLLYYDQSQVDRLEQQLRLLRREERDIEQISRSAVNRLKLVLLPFRLLFGVLFSIIGFLIFLSLLLENIDKAMNSDGPMSGYALTNSSLPNPIDMVMLVAVKLFPLDYLLYIGLVLFLLICSMSGIKAVGIRICCLSLYKIRAWKTHPRGLLLAVLSLMYITLALNVIMFTLLPDYTMFGDQRYQHMTADNKTVVERCDQNHRREQQDDCVPSRISMLLLAFHYKAWIFGAAYYWLTWLLLGLVLLGSCVTIYRIRRPIRTEEEEEDLISD